MRTILVVIILCLNTIACSETQIRPSYWAAPVNGTVLGNFYALDDKVYRSAQPNRKAFLQLEEYGIKEVLNLRQFHTDDDEAAATDIKLSRVKMNAGFVSQAQILEALIIIKNSEGPILIHCWHGSDRTGIVAAAYRIVFQNWSKADAIEELSKGGYGYHSFIYSNIVDTLKTLDVLYLRSQLGLNSRIEGGLAPGKPLRRLAFDFKFSLSRAEHRRFAREKAGRLV